MTERLQVRVLAGVTGELSFPELTFCVDSHLMSIPPYITAVAHKTPSHSAKSADGRLRLNAYLPLTQRSRSGLTVLSGHSGRT